jgi:membrane protein implicated in regulation of membrane protease activity
MLWWIWILLGLGLLVVEMATPGALFGLFFGLSAILVGGLVALGWGGSQGFQWILFSGIAILMLALLRSPLKARLSVDGTHKAVDSLIGNAGVILEAVPTGGVGKVEVRGSGWSARAVEGSLAKGQRCRVDRVDGLTLWVRPE